jgi:predicted component of type VI protein secretion system
MANYREMTQQMPSLADIAARLQLKRRGNRGNPGEVPADAVGGPVSVSIPGESPIQAQPVTGGMGSPAQPLPQQAAQPQMAPGGPQQMNPQAAMDPRAARLRAMMGQGMSFEQAMRRIQQGG